MPDGVEELLKNDGRIYEIFPFMRSFPYSDYELELEKQESNSSSSSINPIIIEAAGGIVEPNLITFTTVGLIANISLSFYSYDIKYVRDVSPKVRKMDEISRVLIEAIESTEFKVKLDAIKIGTRFLKKIGSSLAVTESFNKILDGFMEAQQMSLTTNEEKMVKKLKSDINQDDFDEDAQEIILEFYNLHLHHIRILLGVVIAAKIH